MKRGKETRFKILAPERNQALSAIQKSPHLHFVRSLLDREGEGKVESSLRAMLYPEIRNTSRPLLHALQDLGVKVIAGWLKVWSRAKMEAVATATMIFRHWGKF